VAKQPKKRSAAKSLIKDGTDDSAAGDDPAGLQQGKGDKGSKRLRTGAGGAGNSDDDVTELSAEAKQKLKEMVLSNPAETLSSIFNQPRKAATPRAAGRKGRGKSGGKGAKPTSAANSPAVAKRKLRPRHGGGGGGGGRNRR
jgi:hypothetical protein